MRDKVYDSLKGKEWELLGHYHRTYPSDWIETIERCLNDDNCLWEFRYNSSNELVMITIITNYNYDNTIWNFYIVINDKV